MNGQSNTNLSILARRKTVLESCPGGEVWWLCCCSSRSFTGCDVKEEEEINRGRSCYKDALQEEEDKKSAVSRKTKRWKAVIWSTMMGSITEYRDRQGVRYLSPMRTRCGGVFWSYGYPHLEEQLSQHWWVNINCIPLHQRRYRGTEY